MHPLLAKKLVKDAKRVVSDPQKRRRIMLISAVPALMVPMIALVAIIVVITSMSSMINGLIGGKSTSDDSASSGDGTCMNTTISSLSYTNATFESLDATQVKNSQTIIGIARQLGYDKDGAQIAIMTAYRESYLYNLKNNVYPESTKTKHDEVPANYKWLEKGDHDSSGLFAQRKLYYQDWNGIQDPEKATRWFFKGGVPGVTNYLDAIPDWQHKPKAVVAQMVQHSDVPDGYIAGEPLAKQIVDKLWDTVKSSSGGDTKPSGDATAQNASTTPGCGDIQISGSAQDLLKSWTYPTYKYGRLEQTPGYAAVIAQAKKEGFYTGNPGRVPLGDDCGVFVTNLIVRSGWDKNFNYGGKGQAGNTLTQRAWMEKNWQDLGPASKLKESQLKPLDVGIQDGHVWVYTGPVAGKTGTYAEASERSHYGQGFAPQFNNKYGQAGDSVLNAEEPTAHYFRKK